jgi:hypothetical protein
MKKLQGLNMERNTLHGMVLVGALSRPWSFTSTVTLQVASKLQAWSVTHGLALMIVVVV